jgi:hypothetical protein
MNPTGWKTKNRGNLTRRWAEKTELNHPHH